MFLLIIRLLNISYHSLEICYKNNYQFNDLKIKSLNYQFNDLIFKYISRIKKNKNHKAFTDQFFLDVINFQITNHLSKRVYIYKFSKKLFFLSKFFFLINSYYSIIVFNIIDLIKKLSNKYEIIYENTTNFHSDSIIFFGFPEHSFNYEKNNTNENISSVAEYFFPDIKNIHYNIFTVDEYIRPSKVDFNSPISDNILSIDRLKLKYNVKINWNILDFINFLIKYIKEYYQYFNNLSLISLIYFVNQKKKSDKIYQIIRPFHTKKNKPQLVVLAYYDIGFIKYDKGNSFDFSFFVYSQNVVIPTSPYIINNTLNKNYLFNKEILNETSSCIYSTYLINTKSFTISSTLITNLKKTINRLYNIDLILDNLQNSYFKPVNLGFEGIEDLELNEKSILLFDVPLENIDKSLSRNLIGDVSANILFIQEFFSEILNFAKKNNMNIYIKPKYSIISTISQEFYNSTIYNLSIAFNLKIHYLDPYSKIKLTNKKFTYNFNFPFTSTFYSMSFLAYNSYFYIPSKFVNLVNVNNKYVINGIKNLDNLIK